MYGSIIVISSYHSLQLSNRLNTIDIVDSKYGFWDGIWRSHFDGRRERNISYKGVETSPL